MTWKLEIATVDGVRKTQTRKTATGARAIVDRYCGKYAAPMGGLFVADDGVATVRVISGDASALASTAGEPPCMMCGGKGWFMAGSDRNAPVVCSCLTYAPTVPGETEVERRASRVSAMIIGALGVRARAIGKPDRDRMIAAAEWAEAFALRIADGTDR